MFPLLLSSHLTCIDVIHEQLFCDISPLYVDRTSDDDKAVYTFDNSEVKKKQCEVRRKAL